MQPASRCLCDHGLWNAGVVGDPGDHGRRVGTRGHDRGTLDHLSSGAVRTTEPDNQSADYVVVAVLGLRVRGLLGLGAQALGVYETSVTEYTGRPTRTARPTASLPASLLSSTPSVCTTNASSRPWSRIAATTSLPLASRLPTSISVSLPSKRQLSLKILRDLAGEPTTASERSRSSL